MAHCGTLWHRVKENKMCEILAAAGRQADNGPTLVLAVALFGLGGKSKRRWPISFMVAY